MNINVIARKISKEIVSYKNKDNLSLLEVYNMLLDKYGTFSNHEKNLILLKVTTFYTGDGYDIATTHPLKFKKNGINYNKMFSIDRNLNLDDTL